MGGAARMNLNAIAGPYTRAISPAVLATIQVSTGYVTNPDYSRTPTFVAKTGVTMDVQALSAGMIEHMDALNIQGILRAFWFNGYLEGIDRPAGKGGDLITVPATTLAPAGTYLVVQMIESWDVSGWVHVVGQLQKPS